MIKARLAPRIAYWASWLIAFCLVPGMAACAPLASSDTPTPSPVPATASPTIAWFPATRTPTFTPTFLPPVTLEAPPSPGSLLFADDFSDPAVWNESSSGQATARVQNNRLDLYLNSGPLVIASLRSEPVLQDFQVQVTARLQLCSTKDQFGLLLRASPGGNHYRLVLACNGTVRFERVRNGGAPEVLQNFLPSGDVPPGAPGEVVIQAWLSGSEMRIYLNNHFQFNVRDPVLRSGTLGFFAQAGADTPLLVSFSDLQVHTVLPLTPTRTSLP